ncbi:MAG: hypothetical protein ACYCX7_05310 [Solirubrobacteraceae bacterium]
MRARAAAILAALLATASAGTAQAQPRASAAAVQAAGARAPSGPPLVSGASAYATPTGGSASRREPGEGGEREREAAQGGSEPLIENGLSSPLCTEPGAGLSTGSLADCSTSGFVASAAPAENYGFDVNIDSGPEGSVAAYFQDFLIKTPWALLVWAVRALLVGVEWAYTLDLFKSSAMSSVTSALAGLERSFTQPLLGAALAVAAIALAWRGLVKRDQTGSIGEALAVLAMIAAGLFIVLDPLGSIGSLARFSDTASIATLGTVAAGSPASPDRTLADASTQMFATTVFGPWCFMEFGNVAWCEETRQLDPTLAAAAAKLAAADEAEAGRSGPQRATGLRNIARLLRAAQTNGAIFLAQPANGPARNSIKDASSLLRAICRAPSLSRCRGASASEAEFRTSGFTIDRFVGLAMIGAGALGMLLLLGFILARLLGAAVLSLLFLLAAPAAVLMPAFGERGRSAFRDWLGRLLGAVVAKLLWSFLLGALFLAMKAILMLGGFGWWVQWLMLSVLWWGCFHHRHRILGSSAPVVTQARRERSDPREQRSRTPYPRPRPPRPLRAELERERGQERRRRPFLSARLASSRPASEPRASASESEPRADASAPASARGQRQSEPAPGASPPARTS